MLRATVPLVLASLLAAQGWVDRTSANPLAGPSARAFAGMCFDAAHGYTLLFGGAPPGGISNETWRWDGAAWTHLGTANPSGNWGWNGNAPAATAMAFHAPTNEVVLVFEGTSWTWTGSDWLNIPGNIGNGASGTPKNVAMAHDPVHGQTVLFVGSRFSGGALASAGETFLWTGFGWTQVPAVVTPWPQQYPSMAFDPAAGRLVLGTNGTGQSAFFEWMGSSWQQRLLAGAPTAAGAMATDTAHGCITMLDGVLDAQPNHTWTIANGSLAHPTTPIEPARRFGAAMAFDPIRQRVVMFGGSNYWNYQNGPMLALGDTWEFELGAGPTYTTYGTGCSGSRGVPMLAARSNALPHVGQPFDLALGNLPFAGPVFLFLGVSDTTYGPTPLPFSLAAFGAPSCSILSSGEAPYLVTNVLGSALWSWNVPNVPGVSFYNQAFAFDPAANALGISASNAGHGTIGF